LQLQKHPRMCLLLAISWTKLSNRKDIQRSN
jgi:hypothetical protein